MNKLEKVLCKIFLLTSALFLVVSVLRATSLTFIDIAPILCSVLTIVVLIKILREDYKK